MVFPNAKNVRRKVRHPIHSPRQSLLHIRALLLEEGGEGCLRNVVTEGYQERECELCINRTEQRKQ